jgi:RNA polymerase sigma factor for flagellar operon FliA
MRNVDRLWRNYRRTQDMTYKSELVEEYLPLVKRAVGRVRPFMPDFVEEDDLVGYGFVGLLEAIDRFDLTKQIPFEAFAVKRIQGAILDGLRSMSWLPRNVHQKAKRIEARIEELRTQLGRQPTEDEVAESLSMSVREYHVTLNEVGPVTLMPFEELADHSVDEYEAKAWQHMERQELLEAVAAAVQQLPEREKLVITMYFHEELTLKEIAAVLSVSEGRACQLKTQALLRLRGFLQASGYEYAGA